MSSYVVMQLDKQKSKYTVDVSLDGMPEDRRPYRQLTFCDTDALYRATREDEMIICELISQSTQSADLKQIYPSHRSAFVLDILLSVMLLLYMEVFTDYN